MNFSLTQQELALVAQCESIALQFDPFAIVLVYMCRCHGFHVVTAWHGEAQLQIRATTAHDALSHTLAELTLRTHPQRAPGGAC